MRRRDAFIIIVACIILIIPSVVEGTSPSRNTVNQVETITVGSTTSTSLFQQIVNRAFKVVSTAGGTLHCQLYNVTFLGSQGQFVSGNFTSDIPLNFYIVPDPIFQNWARSENCGNAGTAIASQLNTTAYNFKVAFTSSGPWDFVFVNFSNRDADVFMVAYLSPIGYTTTQPVLSTSTSTFTSATTPAVPVFPVESLTIIAVVGVIVLTAVVVLIALGYGRRKQ